MQNNKKKLFILLGGLVVIVIVIIFALTRGTKPTTKQEAGPSLNNSGVLALKDEKTLVSPLKPNADAVFTVGDGAVTPRSFMVEYPSEASLTITSGDNQAHEIVFENPEVGIDKTAVAAGESKKVNFKTPKPGQYAFSCSVAGHKEKGEVGELIVSEKPTKVNPIAVFNKVAEENKIPGVNLLISNGVMSPNKFTVAAELPISFAIISGDGKSHNVIFSDAAVKAEAVQAGANENKAITFTAPKAGEYDFSCNVPGHEKETGKMIVK